MNKTQPYIASVLIPTFSRKQSKTFAFERIIKTLKETIADPDDVEILIKRDTGDVETETLCEQYEKEFPHFKSYESPSLGYRYINTYLDFIAPHAKGQFLAMWADDSTVETKGWDKILYNYIDKTTWFLKPFHGQLTKGNLSPIMHIELYKLVGHTGHYPTDWFWDNIQFVFPIQWPVPEIHVLHRWTEVNEENATDEIQGPLRIDHAEATRIIQLVQAARENR